MLKNNKTLFIIAAAALILAVIAQVSNFAASARFRKEQKKLDELNKRIEEARNISEATKDLIYTLNQQQSVSKRIIDSLSTRQAALTQSISEQKRAYDKLKKSIKVKTTNYRDSSANDILNFLPKK